MKPLIFGALVTVLWSLGCGQNHPQTGSTIDAAKSSEHGDRSYRGNPWDYDPGPRRESGWAEIMADTPHYRALGQRVMGTGKFRWVYGPMYYRGRLGKNEVKVFVVGQEGAQDENLSNRSFTGSTGTGVQSLIYGMNIFDSYLYMNTFAYTINGQYDEAKIHELAQYRGTSPDDPSSPLVTHRDRMFDQMLALNKDSLNLLVGVGRAGQETLINWIQHKWNTQTGEDGYKKCRRLNSCFASEDGFQCDDQELACDASILGPSIKAIGLPHPGGRKVSRKNQQRIDATFVAVFTRLIAKWMDESKGEWLRPDYGLNQDFASFRYGKKSIPHRDFYFGLTPRLGYRNTTSNRRGKEAIQLYLQGGEYNARVKYRPYRPKDLTRDANPLFKMPEMKQGVDRPWEPPRYQAAERYDRGPNIWEATADGEERIKHNFSKLLMGYESPHEGWPEFWHDDNLKLSDQSLGATSLFRGRLNRARILVLADQKGHERDTRGGWDDPFTGRALSGLGGQRLQSLLRKLGFTRSYAILRTLPVDTSQLSMEEIESLALDPRCLDIRRSILDRIISISTEEGYRPDLIITIGKVAEQAMRDYEVPDDIPVVAFASPRSPKFWHNWQRRLTAIKEGGFVRHPDVEPTYRYGRVDYPNLKNTPAFEDIPRIDFPFHSRFWFGHGGDRVVRGGLRNESPLYYKISANQWVKRIDWDEIPTSDEDEAYLTARGL